MKGLAHRLSKLKPTTFKFSYSPTYTSFLPNHIATNALHPLHIAQRRRQQEHKQEGLWWHATNGTDISKSSCVRHWARRRLKQAFVEELRARGYDENGRLVDEKALQGRVDVMNVVRSGRSVSLTGSLRMHGVAPLVPAKYEAVKEEVRGVVDALIQSSVDAALGFAGEGERSGGLGQRQRPQNRRSAATPETADMSRKKAEDASEKSRMKPTASPRSPPRTRSAPPRMKPKAAPAKAAPRTRKPITMSLGENYCV